MDTRSKTGKTMVNPEKCSQPTPGKSPNLRITDKSKVPLDGRVESLSRSVNTLKNNLDEMRTDLYAEENGLSVQLRHVSEQAECNYDDISLLRSENAQLRRELDLLRSVIIRMDRRMETMDNEITDLRDRSMRDNILIHNFPYTPKEDLSTTIPDLIKQTLGVDVNFIRIHRNGVRPQNSDRPVTITAKLTDRSKKDEILSAQKVKKIAKVSLPFYITPQQPPSLVSARNKLFDKSDSLKKQNINVKISRNNIIMPNGSKYREEVPLLTNADVLQIDPSKTEKLDEIVTKSAEPIKKNGSEFYAIGSKVNSGESVMNFYQKVCIDPYVASVDSRILVYRFEERGKVTENYHDDGEHGAGRRLLKYMRDNQIINAAFIVTRWMGEHIGPQRFTIMESLVNEVANQILDE